MDRKRRSKLLNHARPFDLCIDVDEEKAFGTLIDQLFDEARTAGNFAGRIDSSTQKRDLGILVANVLKAEQTEFNPFQRIPLRPTHYCVFRPMTDRIPGRWRTPFRWHGGQCSGQMADSFGLGAEGCPP